MVEPLFGPVIAPRIGYTGKGGMMMRLSILAGTMIGLGLPAAASAQIVFNENFDVDHTANWSANPFTTTPAQIDFANFFFDYSTVGIPPAPGGTTTRGLRLTANVNPSAT